MSSFIESLQEDDQDITEAFPEVGSGVQQPRLPPSADVYIPDSGRAVDAAFSSEHGNDELDDFGEPTPAAFLTHFSHFL
jgi:hypothetical protein